MMMNDANDDGIIYIALAVGMIVAVAAAMMPCH